MPVWPYVRDVVPHWLLPGSESLGQGEVVAMRTCPEFIEAFLLGLNQRALGELAWRQHPLRVGCTPLRRFWNHLPPGPGGRGDDISGVKDWTHNSQLGSHAPAGIRAEKLVVVVRSPLFRRYPRTLLFLAPNKLSPPNWGKGNVDLTKPVMPQFVAAMGPDLTLFVFRRRPGRREAALGRGPGDAGGHPLQARPARGRTGACRALGGGQPRHPTARAAPRPGHGRRPRRWPVTGSVGVLLPARLETRFDQRPDDGHWILRVIVVPGEASLDVHTRRSTGTS